MSRSVCAGALLLAIGLVTPRAAFAEPSATPAIALEPSGITGYGGAEFKVTWIADRVALLGGGPLFVLMIDRRFATGMFLNATEGDADGLQLAYVGPFVSYDLTPDGPLHFSLEAIGQVGTAINDTPAGARSRATHYGVEPRIALALDVEPSARVALTASYRFSRLDGELRPIGIRDTSGPVLGLQLQEGNFHGGTSHRNWSLSGCFSTRISTLAGELTYLDGGGTRVMFHDTWALGIGGYVTRDWFRSRPQRVSGGWGGVTGEYLFLPGALLRPWSGLLVAMGGIGRRTPEGDEVAPLFVVEPTLGAQFGVTEFLRVAAGGSYRLAACFECLAGESSRTTSGPSGVVELRFGDF